MKTCLAGCRGSGLACRVTIAFQTGHLVGIGAARRSSASKTRRSARFDYMQPQEGLFAPGRNWSPDSEGRPLNAKSDAHSLCCGASTLPVRFGYSDGLDLRLDGARCSPISPSAPLDLHSRPRMQLGIPRQTKRKKISDEN